MFVLCCCKAVKPLVLKELEQEVNTAPHTSNLVIILQDVISTGEELGSCYDILCESVVSTDQTRGCNPTYPCCYDILCESVVSTEFPALQGREALPTSCDRKGQAEDAGNPGQPFSAQQYTSLRQLRTSMAGSGTAMARRCGGKDSFVIYWVVI